MRDAEDGGIFFDPEELFKEFNEDLGQDIVNQFKSGKYTHLEIIVTVANVLGWLMAVDCKDRSHIEKFEPTIQFLVMSAALGNFESKEQLQ